MMAPSLNFILNWEWVYALLRRIPSAKGRFPFIYLIVIINMKTRAELDYEVKHERK